MAAAAHVFADEGLAATTDRIASRAGVSIGSLYQYFPNKDALLLALAQRHLKESLGPLLLALRPGRPSAEWLPAAVRLVVDMHVDADLHRVVYDQAPRTAELAEAFMTAQLALRDTVAGLLDAEFQLPESLVTATVLVALVESLTHRLVGQLPHEVLVCEVTRAATAYLRSASRAGPDHAPARTSQS